MVTRFTATVDVTPFEQLQVFFEQFEDVAYSEFEDTVEDNKANILDELQTQPQSAVHPIEWASEKQRKFVMAKLRRENNLPYQRTGKLAQGWVVEVKRESGNFFMVIENPSSISKFVYGSLAQNRAVALRFQQPFHRNTGWQAATDTVQFWIDAVIEDYRNRMLRLAIISFKGRAFTR